MLAVNIQIHLTASDTQRTDPVLTDPDTHVNLSFEKKP